MRLEWHICENIIMAQGQFLIRNRHCNQWYGRVIIPQTLREHFHGKREFRRSLKTSDKTTAKRRALEFWVECQNGFERIEQEANPLCHPSEISSL